MKKIIKLTLKIIGGLVGLVLLAAILIPIIYKNDIRNAIDAEIDKNLNATVFYDVDAFGVSLFRSFPNLSIRMGDFGIKGEGVFEEDTLMSVSNFELTIDLMSLFDEITINKIQLDEPRILVLVLEDGTANYDIAVPAEEIAEVPIEEESAEADGLSIKINKWEINNADVVYYDLSMDFYTTLEDLNHSGSGDFSADVFQMITSTNVGAFSLGYEGTEYLTEKSVTAEVTMNMDLANMTFAFAENRVAVNNFGFGFDGVIGMPGDDISLDLTFAGKNIDMKSVLSLIPGAYEEYLEGIEASGKISFDGAVKGVYNDESMPNVTGAFNVKDGLVNSADLPSPLEQMNVGLEFSYLGNDPINTKILLDFIAQMAGQKSFLQLTFQNLDDYQWDVNMGADMDLAELAKILPLEGSELKGLINARLLTKGKMSDVEAEQWSKLPTSGKLEASDFLFKGPDFPQGFGMSKVDAEFDPQKIELKTFEANAGRTDLDLSGKLTNYLAFALGEDEKLLGTLKFASKKVDLNEWMTSEEVVVEDAPVDTASLEVVRIPVNIDFKLASSIDELLYDNLTLENFKGNLLVQNGSIILEGAGFKMLGGSFTLDGEYASAPEQPTFDFDFGIKELSIPESFKAFTPIQKLVPVANKMTGTFSTNFAASGALGSDMMPLMNSLSGSGLVEIAEAAMKNVKVLDGVTKLANLKGGSNSETLANLKDVALSMQIKDGRLSVKPFNLTISGNETVVSGSTGLDGSLDYAMAMKVPSGQAGQAVNQALSKFTGGNSLVSDFLNLSIGIGGTYDDPKIKLLGAKPAEGKGSLTDSVKEQVKEKVDKKVAEAKEKVDEKVTEVKEEVKQKVEAKVDTAKAVVEKVVEEKKEEVKKKAADETKDKLNSLLKKKKKSGN